MSSRLCIVENSQHSSVDWMLAARTQTFSGSIFRALAVAALLVPSFAPVARGQGASPTASQDDSSKPWAMSVQVKVLEAGAASPVIAPIVVVRRIGSERSSHTDKTGTAVITGTGSGEVGLQIIPPGVPACGIAIPAPRALVSVLIDKAHPGSCKLEE